MVAQGSSCVLVEGRAGESWPDTVLGVQPAFCSYSSPRKVTLDYWLWFSPVILYCRLALEMLADQNGCNKRVLFLGEFSGCSLHFCSLSRYILDYGLLDLRPSGLCLRQDWSTVYSRHLEMGKMGTCPVLPGTPQSFVPSDVPDSSCRSLPTFRFHSPIPHAFLKYCSERCL